VEVVYKNYVAVALHNVDTNPFFKNLEGFGLPKIFSPPPLEKCFGHNLKLLDIV